MATHRVAEIMKARSTFSDEEIAGLTESEAWQWIYQNPSAFEGLEDELLQDMPRAD